MTKERVHSVLGVTAGVPQFVGFAIYDYQILTGDSIPNPTSWGLWSVIATLNFLSYFYMNKDRAKATLPGVSAAANALTFGWMWFHGSLMMPGRFDLMVAGVTLAAVVLWWILKNAKYANLMIQVAIITSFFPMIVGVLHDPSLEGYLPWLIWTGGYVLLLLSTMLKWNSWIDFALPINGLALHGIVTWLSLREIEVMLQCR